MHEQQVRAQQAGGFFLGWRLGLSLSRCTNSQFLPPKIIRGIELPLEVFKVGGQRGWGLRCASAITSGTFVCCYIGELNFAWLVYSHHQFVCLCLAAGQLITEEMANTVTNDVYLFDLDHFEVRCIASVLP